MQNGVFLSLMDKLLDDSYAQHAQLCYSETYNISHGPPTVEKGRINFLLHPRSTQGLAVQSSSLDPTSGLYSVMPENDLHHSRALVLE